MINSTNGLPPIENIARYKEQTAASAGAKTEAIVRNDEDVSVDNTGSKDTLKSPSDKKTQDVKVDFKDLARKLETMLEGDDRSIQFSLDKDTKKMILKVLDSNTNEVLQQFPPEITLKIARIVAASMDNVRVADAKI